MLAVAFSRFFAAAFPFEFPTFDFLLLLLMLTLLFIMIDTSVGRYKMLNLYHTPVHLSSQLHSHIFFITGKFNAASYASSSGFTSGPRRGAYSEAAVEELLMEAGAYRRDKGIDVLLTSEWGKKEEERKR